MNETSATSNEKTLLEIRQIFLPISYQLQLYSIPIFLTVGILGNPISFVVWVSRKLRRNNSSAVYIAMLAINDFFVVICSIIYYLRHSWGFGIIDIRGICKFYMVIFTFLQYNSILLVFGFTIERWIAVCYPFRRERCCTENRAWIACGIIFSSVFISVFPLFFVWHYQPLCSVPKHWIENTYFVTYSLTLEILFSALLPVITLAVNIRVVVEMYRISETIVTFPKLSAVNQNFEIPSQKSRKHSKNTENSLSFKSTTITLLLVSFFQILTTLPLGAVYICQIFYPEGNATSVKQMQNDPIWKKHFQMHGAKDIIDLLSLSHYCFNIVIYLASSHLFRNHLMGFVKLYLMRKENNNSLNNSYYKLRQSQDTHKTEMSIRRKLVESKVPLPLEVSLAT